MLATLSYFQRELRDQAILLVGFSGGLSRFEITGLDSTRDDFDAEGADGVGAGWVEIVPGNLLLILRGTTGRLEVEIGRRSAPATCPVFQNMNPELRAHRDFRLPPASQDDHCGDDCVVATALIAVP